LAVVTLAVSLLIMAQTQPPVEAIIWTDATRAALVRSVLEQMPTVRALAVSGPRKGELHELGEALNLPPGDDLRKMLIDAPAQFLLLATATAAGRDDLQLARQQSVHVICLAPPAAQSGDLLEYRRGQEPGGRLVHAPMWRLSPAWLAAADPLELLGSIQSLSLTALSTTGHSTLYARLHDAIDLVVHLMGLPDSIDAALTGPLPEPPESLRGLTGCLTAHLRFADRAGATLHVSDQGQAWYRQCQIIGRQGQLVLSDRDYRLITDQASESSESPGGEVPANVDSLIARQWQWMVDHQVGPDVADARKVLACCQAALLSCRTGQGESPHALMQMAG
jgi:predicted dehydrogenase